MRIVKNTTHLSNSQLTYMVHRVANYIKIPVPHLKLTAMPPNNNHPFGGSLSEHHMVVNFTPFTSEADIYATIAHEMSHYVDYCLTNIVGIDIATLDTRDEERRANSWSIMFVALELKLDLKAIHPFWLYYEQDALAEICNRTATL